MDRIDDPTAEADLFGSGKDGFTEGDGGLVLPTRVRKAWLNGVQEEILAAIEGSGQTPSGSDLDQLWEAISIRALQYARCAVSGTAASGANFGLTLTSQRGGYSVASNQLTVPANGLYLVLLHGQVSIDDTADNRRMQVRVSAGPLDWIGPRPGTDASAQNTATIASAASCTVASPVHVTQSSGDDEALEDCTLILVRIG